MPYVVMLCRVSSSLKQQLSHICVTLLTRPLQTAPSTLYVTCTVSIAYFSLLVGIGAFIQQLPHNL